MEVEQKIDKVKELVTEFRFEGSSRKSCHRFVNVLKSCLALRGANDEESFFVEQLIIFNLFSLRHDSEECTHLLEKSVTVQAQLLDPLFSPSHPSNLTERLKCSAKKICGLPKAFNEHTLQILLSNISSAALYSDSLHCLEVIKDLRKKIENCSATRNFDCCLLIHRLFPLVTVSDPSHIEDVCLLNTIILNMKSNVQSDNILEDIKTISERKELASLGYFFSFLECLVLRSRGEPRGESTRYKRLLNSIMEPYNCVLELVRIEALLLNGYDLMKSKCYKLSLAAFYQAIKDAPSCIRGLVLAAESLKLSANFRSAIELLKLAIKIRKTKPEEDKENSSDQYISTLLSVVSPCKNVDTLTLYEELGNLLLMVKDFQQSATTFITCLKDYESSDFPADKLHRLRIGACLALLLAGHPGESLVISQFVNTKVALKRKLDSDHFQFIIAFLLGKGYLETDQTAKCTASLDKALKTAISLSQGPPEKKLKDDNSNIQHKDDARVQPGLCLAAYSRLRSRIYFEKSKLYLKTGDRTSFKQSLEAAVSLNPSEFILQQYLELIQNEEGHRSDEIEKIQKWRENNPETDNLFSLDMSHLDIVQLTFKFMTEDNF